MEFITPLAGILALLFALFMAKKVKSSDQGTKRMIELSQAINEGAMAFLGREYSMLTGFVVVVGIIIVPTLGWQTALSFVLGAIFFWFSWIYRNADCYPS